MSEQDYKIESPSDIDGDDLYCDICRSIIFKEMYFDTYFRIYEIGDYNSEDICIIPAFRTCLKCSPLLIMLLNHVRSNNEIYGDVTIKQVKERILNNTKIFDTEVEQHDKTGISVGLGMTYDHVKVDGVCFAVVFDKSVCEGDGTSTLIDSILIYELNENDPISKINDSLIIFRCIIRLINFDFREDFNKVSVAIKNAPFETTTGRTNFVLLADMITDLSESFYE